MRNTKTYVPFLADMLSSARYEVLPTGSIEAKVLEHVPLGTTVTVTASPAKGIEATLALAESLARQGYAAVPHLAARMISGRTELAEISARLTAAGVRTVFVPGGDQDPAAGDYTCALDLLEDLTALGRPFPEVGIAGYPESHPKIHDDLTVQAMWDKRRHATHIVSNLTFDSGAVKSWVERMRARGITQPVLLGMPGPIDRAKLLSMATKIGVGESTRFLSKNAGFFAKLAAPGGWTGQKFLEEVATTAMKPQSLIEGLHIFTFNQIAATEEWRQEMLSSLG